MPRAAVIGEMLRVRGYGLVGAVVYPAEDADQARAAWRSLPPDIAVVVLTARAASWLGEAPQPREGLLPVVMPP
jgi:vacuolar-type H+-ATPase subunit F/Vma7